MIHAINFYSWNRSPAVGHAVVAMKMTWPSSFPVAAGTPAVPPPPVVPVPGAISDLISYDGSTATGGNYNYRPVDVAVGIYGEIYVTSDTGSVLLLTHANPAFKGKRMGTGAGGGKDDGGSSDGSDVGSESASNEGDSPVPRNDEDNNDDDDDDNSNATFAAAITLLVGASLFGGVVAALYYKRRRGAAKDTERVAGGVQRDQVEMST
jgi:hypothetical protein